ncbi:DUF4389 domain-containing protein [Marinomonas sp.]
MSKSGYAEQGFWFRLIFMLVYWALLNVAITVFGILLIIVSIIKFGSRHHPETLASWLRSVALFIQQTFEFLSYKSEDKPFPFQSWPQVDTDEEA